MGMNSIAERKAHRANIARSHQKFNQKYGKGGASGYQHHANVGQPSIPRLKRASGLMTKSRREMQQKLATGQLNIHGDMA